MKINFILIFLALNSLMYTQNKQKDSLPTTWELLKYDGVSAFKGLTTTYKKPLGWQKDDFLIAGAIVVGTGALYIVDEETNRWFQNQDEDIPEILKDIGFYYGKPQYNYGLTGAVYLFGLLTKNDKIRKTGVLLISAATTAGLIQTVSKTAIGRARPGTGEGKGSFEYFSAEADFHSFPSGHTIISFTTAYAIGKQFKNPYIKAGIYGIGLISPISRLWAGAHWLTDVALSMAISILVVDSIDNYLNQERDYGNTNKNKISWKFQMGLGQIGVTGTF
ncbi:MAG: phosphatase PAP2 family protein [Flavobacteriaceae bacterium]